MRLVHASVFAIAAALVMPVLHAQDADKKVAGGGITAPGWKGKVDAGSAKTGMTINDSKFVQKGTDIQVQTGPAATYWNPAHTAKGDYTVKATFKDMKSDAGHAHPVGVFIGGSGLDTDAPSFTYCVAYTDGSFLVRQFKGAAPVATVMRKTPNDVVKKPGADGLTTNEVGWTVKGGKAECVINGTSVASFDAAAVPADGTYGLRIAHNMSAVVSGFGMSK